METLKEFWGGFRGQVADRLGNPFAGAFLIAWVAFNFRLLVVLFWIEPYREKFQYIDEMLYPHFGYWLLRGVVLPILGAYAYLFLYARCTTAAVAYYRRMQSNANNQIRAAAGEALMSIAENQKALLRLAQSEARWQQDQIELNEALERQKELNNAQTLEALEAQKKAAQQSAKLDELRLVLEERKSGKGGTDLVFSEPVEPPKKDNDEGAFQLRKPNSFLPHGAMVSPYTGRQLTILQLLRNGAEHTSGQLQRKLGGEPFEIRTDLNKLKKLGLIFANNNDVISPSEEGLELLRAFIEERQWTIDPMELVS